MKPWSSSYTCGTLSGCMLHQSVQSLPGGHVSSCPQLTMFSVLESWELARLWEPQLSTESDENYLKFMRGYESQFANLTETSLFPFWSTVFRSWTLIPLIWWEILSLAFLDVPSSTLCWHQTLRDFDGNEKNDEEALTSAPTWLVLTGLCSRLWKFLVSKGSLLYCCHVFGTSGPRSSFLYQVTICSEVLLHSWGTIRVDSTDLP